MDWIHVPQEVDQWRAILKTAAIFRVLWLSKNVFTNGMTLYFSRTLAHAVVLFGSYLFFIICLKVSIAGRIPVQSQRTFLTSLWFPQINTPSVDPVLNTLLPEGFQWMWTLRILKFGTTALQDKCNNSNCPEMHFFGQETLLFCSLLFDLSLVWFYPLKTRCTLVSQSETSTRSMHSAAVCCIIF